MNVCGKALRLRHAICVAHIINLIVKKSLDLTPVLFAIRIKARRLGGYFRKVGSLTLFSYLLMHYLFIIAPFVTITIIFCFLLALIQEQMGKPKLKLIQEVEQHLPNSPETGRRKNLWGQLWVAWSVTSLY